MHSILSGIMICFAILGVAFSPGGASPAITRADDTPPPLRIMTFNIRYHNPEDGPNAWPHRKETVAGLIRFHEADIVGVQEAQSPMLADLDSLLTGYDWFGLPRDSGDPHDEYSAILYRPDRLELLDHQTFWLSETPEVRGSKGWDAALPRIVTWGKFRDKATGKIFFHFNTHFDHRGQQARRESARLLRKRIGEIAGSSPVTVTGDFNAEVDSEPYRIMTAHIEGDRDLRDSFHTSEQPHYGPVSTWDGFKAIDPGRRIDFIFTGTGIHVVRHGTLADIKEDGLFPSDHLPVLAEVVLP